MAGVVGGFLSTACAHASPDLDISFKDFDGDQGHNFVMSGDAALDGSRIRLTRAEGNLAGSAMYSKPVWLPRDRSFSAYFTFSMTPFEAPEKPPADGIVFVLHNDSKNIGVNGEGIGYRGILSSVAVEFDTFHNAENLDPDPKHVGINLNGEMKSIATAPLPVDLSEGSTRHAWIEYDGSTKTLEVRVATSATRPEKALLSHTVDLEGTLRDSPKVGFTAGTGALNEEHHIESLYFVGDYLRDGILLPEEGCPLRSSYLWIPEVQYLDSWPSPVSIRGMLRIALAL
jgi:hypothetical protein